MPGNGTLVAASDRQIVIHRGDPQPGALHPQFPRTGLGAVAAWVVCDCALPSVARTMTHGPRRSTPIVIGLAGACLVATLLMWQDARGGLRAPGLASAPAAQARRCAPGPNATGAPRNIEQVVDLINSLPKPVTVACFVESLDAPLKVFASKSVASLQLSTGPDDPRWFIFSLPLIISVTSDGPGADLLEMGVLQPGNKRTLLGELRMPIETEIKPALPYDRISKDAGTSCGFFCHQNEVRDPRIGFAEAFVSKAIRAAADSEVPIESLRGALSRCKSPTHGAGPTATNSARCALLHALLVTGRAQREDFPADMPVGF